MAIRIISPKPWSRLLTWLALPCSLWRLVREPGVPAGVKVKAALFLIIPALYVLNPFDLIPEITPLGWLDDLLVLPLAAWLARKLVPEVDVARLASRSASRVRRAVLAALLAAGGMALLFIALITVLIYAAVRALAS
ncbi:MAG: DUF1232 domain-containing protein [Chloroflexi bacterium]|nr:DUF1232 domain-containing protein [Chloroflexota bacterium]